MNSLFSVKKAYLNAINSLFLILFRLVMSVMVIVFYSFIAIFDNLIRFVWGIVSAVYVWFKRDRYQFSSPAFIVAHLIGIFTNLFGGSTWMLTTSEAIGASLSYAWIPATIHIASEFGFSVPSWAFVVGYSLPAAMFILILCVKSMLFDAYISEDESMWKHAMNVNRNGELAAYVEGHMTDGDASSVSFDKPDGSAKTAKSRLKRAASAQKS